MPNFVNDGRLNAHCRNLWPLLLFLSDSNVIKLRHLKGFLISNVSYLTFQKTSQSLKLCPHFLNLPMHAVKRFSIKHFSYEILSYNSITVCKQVILLYMICNTLNTPAITKNILIYVFQHCSSSELNYL